MFQLELEQEFDIPVERIYQAWIRPEMMKVWFAPGNMTIPEAEANAEVGGKYKVVMQEEDGDLHIALGEFKELVENEKIVMTWRWQESPNTTLLTLTFVDLGENKSLLKLKHSEFIKEEYRDSHLDGWQGCLANLLKVA